MCKVFFQCFVVILAVLFAAPKLSSVQPITVSMNQDRFAGKRIIITGGTAGVGLEAAKYFVEHGAQVIVTSRSLSRASAVAEDISLSSPGRAHGLALDLTDVASVHAFSKSALANLGTDNLDILVLNAGMIYGPDYAGPFTTSYPGGNVETMFAANHLGHFLILQEFFPEIVQSNTRVIFVSSISHHLATAASTLPENTINSSGGIEGTAGAPIGSMFLTYGATKCMNVLTANKLNRLLDSEETTTASAVVVTPGFAATSIGSADRSRGLFNPLDYLPLAFSAQHGGSILVAAAVVDRAVATNKMIQPYWIWEDVPLSGIAKGVFHNFFQEAMLQKISGGLYAHAQSTVAQDEKVQDRVWDWSLRMTKTKK